MASGLKSGLLTNCFKIVPVSNSKRGTSIECSGLKSFFVKPLSSPKARNRCPDRD